MSDNSIGIFDSGVGGTTIWRAINNLLPNEKTIYLSDSINAPYGQKSISEITELCVKNTEVLLEKNCKLIVVACNTATTSAINYLRKNYKVPFIGIEPAVKTASIKTKTNTIGILATERTLNSELFEETCSKINSDINIIKQVGKNLVELIENNKIESPEIHHLLNIYTKEMIQKGADCIVLGCTHYPYLKGSIQSIVGNQIEIIDSGKAVAKQTKNILSAQNLINNKPLSEDYKHLFYSNTSTTVIDNLLEDKKKLIQSYFLDF